MIEPRAVDPSPGFVLFGTGHLAILFALTLAAVGLVLGRRSSARRNDRRVRQLLAALLAGNELFSWVIAAVQGQMRIPLQLCDVALWLIVWALLGGGRPARELAYFWGVAGSVQAVLTPDVRAALTSYWTVKFFLGHGGIILSAVYLAVTGRIRPTHRSVWLAWGWTNVYAVTVGYLNGLFGTNYGFLAHKPTQPSLLDYFGPWPYYILVMEVAALLSFYLCYAPFALRRRPIRRR